MATPLFIHVLGEVVNCRVDSKRVAFGHFSYCPPPNRACGFHRTRLSSVSFHLSFFLDDIKNIFDLLCISHVSLSFCLTHLSPFAM